MEDFAKIFRDETYGQVLVFAEENEDGKPCINIYFRPRGLGVCKIGANFEDDDEGWNKQEKAFEKINEETAINAVKSVIDYLDQDEDDELLS